MQPHKEIHDENQRQMDRTTVGDWSNRTLNIDSCWFLRLYPNHIGAGGCMHLLGDAVMVLKAFVHNAWIDFVGGNRTMKPTRDYCSVANRSTIASL